MRSFYFWIAYFSIILSQLLQWNAPNDGVEPLCFHVIQLAVF